MSITKRIKAIFQTVCDSFRLYNDVHIHDDLLFNVPEGAIDLTISTCTPVTDGELNQLIKDLPKTIPELQKITADAHFLNIGAPNRDDETPNPSIPESAIWITIPRNNIPSEQNWTQFRNNIQTCLDRMEENPAIYALKPKYGSGVYAPPAQLL